MSVEVYTADGRSKGKGQSFAPQGVVFSGTLSADTSATTGWRKVPINVKNFDPFNFFDLTNNRFQPKAPGYYRLSANMFVSSGNAFAVAFYKNGSIWHEVAEGAGDYVKGGSTLVYLNGSTDYVEMWGWTSVSTAFRVSGGMTTAFHGELVASSIGVAPEPWHFVGATGEPAFTNSWTNHPNATYADVSFRKDPHGVVHLRGLIEAGGASTAMFTLPAGYRPGSSDALICACYSSTGAAAVDVFGSGAVTHRAGPASAGAWISLAGITFRAEQ